MKLPGVISFLKDLPICPIPKGTFFLALLCTFLKSKKGNDVIVAVIDTDINTNHEDIKLSYICVI